MFGIFVRKIAADSFSISHLMSCFSSRTTEINFNVMCENSNNTGWYLPSWDIQQSERRCELSQRPDSFWIWRNSRRPPQSAPRGSPAGHRSHSHHTASALNTVFLYIRWRGGRLAGKWNIKSCMNSRVSSAHLDVSSFFIPVLESGYTAVLLLQTGHRAFYECDTGGRNYTVRDITCTCQCSMGNMIRKNYWN